MGDLFDKTEDDSAHLAMLAESLEELEVVEATVSLMDLETLIKIHDGPEFKELSISLQQMITLRLNDFRAATDQEGMGMGGSLTSRYKMLTSGRVVMAYGKPIDDWLAEF